MKQRSFYLFIILGLICMSTFAIDNDSPTVHQLSFQTDYYQIKDEFNYGLVINGMNLALEYDLLKVKQDRMFSYSADLAFGPGYRQGIALNWHLKPLDFFYGYKVNNEHKIYLGGYISSNYQWQLYPELQSGHMLWFSSLEIGPRLHAMINLGKQKVKLRVSNSLAGLSSRPSPSTEQYFYSLKFSDFIENPHSNIKFGTSNLMNHTNLKVELPNAKGKRLNLAYEFDYMAHFKDTRVEYLTHSLKLSWTLGKLNKQ